MTDLPKIPSGIKLNPNEVVFSHIFEDDDAWYIIGPIDKIREENITTVTHRSGTTTDVYITKHIMSRKVYHRRAEKLVEYVVATFENVVEDDE